MIKPLQPQVITRCGQSDAYQLRWTIIRCCLFDLLLHKFVGEDTASPHSHPGVVISIGLWGSYIDEVYEAGMLVTKKFSAPWIRWIPSSVYHKISVVDKPCWTIVLHIK